MKTSIRRHWFPTVAYVFLFINGLFTVANDTHVVIHILRIVMGVIGCGAVIWTLRYKNVFEFKDDQLIFYRMFRSPMKIHREHIDFISLEEHVLRSSKLILKNGKAYAFSDGDISSFAEIRSFMHHAGIPVKG